MHLCLTLMIEGCIDANAKYNQNAIVIMVHMITWDALILHMIIMKMQLLMMALVMSAIYGCADAEYLEFWQWEVSPFNSQLYLLIDSIRPILNVDDESCSVEIVRGCLYDDYLEYNPNTNVLDVSMYKNVIVTGCTDPNAIEESFNPNANVDDGSCQILGCVNSFAFNFN